MEYEWDIDGIWESPQKNIYLGMVYDGLPNVLAEIKW